MMLSRYNNQNNTYLQQPLKQLGATAVELMVAITIGSVLIIGLIEIFHSNKQSYRLQENLSFMQENGRFAMNKLSNSIRMTGHWGSVDGKSISDATGITIAGIGDCHHNWITDFDTAIMGFEGASTAGSTDVPSNCFSDSDYVANSDIVVVRYANAADIVATADLSKTSDPNNANMVFIRSSIDTGSSAILGSAGIPASIPDEDGTYNYPYSVELYYIRKCSLKISGTCQDNIPTLTRLRISPDVSSTPTLIEEPIAENIEQVQLQYGRDTNADGDVDRYDPADSLATADWDDVVNVRISLIARAGQIDNNFSDTNTYAMLDYNHTPASADAYFHRKQYDRTIQIRNRNRQ